MELKSFRYIDTEDRRSCIRFTHTVEEVMRWNTYSLLSYTEQLSHLDEYGARFIYSGKQIIAMFIISDKDGNNEGSDNLKHLQSEDEAYWLCSLYILPEYRGSLTLLNMVASLLEELKEKKAVYAYIENEKLERILSGKLNKISSNPTVFKARKHEPIYVGGMPEEERMMDKQFRDNLYQSCP